MTTITALFDTREHAEQAREKLQSVGVTDVRISQHDDGSDRPAAMRSADAAQVADPVRDVTEGDYGEGHHGEGRHESLWSKIKHLFTDRDWPFYEEGLRRGHVALTAKAAEGRADEAARVLSDCGAVDVNRRAEEWRAAGWTGVPPHDPSVAGHVGDDRVTGHHGDDRLHGASDDQARLGEGDDKLGAPPHDPSVAGHVGDDRVTGHHGDDRLHGASDDQARLSEGDRLMGEPRAFSAADAGIDPTAGEDPDEVERRRLAGRPSPTT